LPKPHIVALKPGGNRNWQTHGNNPQARTA
jgi:hypothetical protein